MPADVSLVIRAEDAFSAAFGQLDAAFRQTSARGAEADASLDAVQHRLNAVGQAATHAGEAARVGGEAVVQAEADLQTRLTSLSASGQAERRSGLDAHLRGVEGALRASAATQTSITVGHFQQVASVTAEWSGRLLAITRSHGNSLFALTKQVEIARGTINAFAAANSALASTPFPANIGFAALVLAEGLANVKQIQGTSVAHGGLEQVPEDATFLLRQGERVLSPGQNRDLTRFLEASPQGAGRGSGGVHVEHLTVRVLDNATQAGALLEMSVEDWRQVVAERIVPALDGLAQRGLRPRFVEGNL